MMKNRLIAVFFFYSIVNNFAQGQQQGFVLKQDNRLHFETMLLPALIYNSISLGLSKSVSQQVEQAVTMSAFAVWVDGPWLYSFALRYNYNITVSNRKKISTYVPLWLSSRYLHNSGSVESETPASEYLFYSIGSGYGLKFNFKNKHKLRLETGLGIALNTQRVYQNYKQSHPLFKVENKQPFLPTLRLSLKYLIPLGRR